MFESNSRQNLLLDKGCSPQYNTHMDTQLNQMIEAMVAHGMLRLHAFALATSIRHSMKSPDFAETYGAFMVAALQDFLKEAIHDQQL